MCVYLRVKFVVSSIILTSFRQGVILHLLPPPPPRPHYALSQGEPLKSPPRLGIIIIRKDQLVILLLLTCVWFENTTINFVS